MKPHEAFTAITIMAVATVLPIEGFQQPSASPSAMAGQADVILLGEKIITSETKQTTAEAIALAAELRDRLEQGELVGPRLRITGPSLTAPGGHPATTVCRSDPVCRRRATRELEGEAQARELIEEVVRAKVDAIKVVVDDTVVNTPPLSDAVVAAIVADAHRAGARVIAHVAVRDEVATAKRLIEIGVDEFVHPSCRDV